MAILLVFAAADQFTFVFDDCDDTVLDNDFFSEEFVGSFGSGTDDMKVGYLLAWCIVAQIFDP